MEKRNFVMLCMLGSMLILPGMAYATGGYLDHMELKYDRNCTTYYGQTVSHGETVTVDKGSSFTILVYRGGGSAPWIFECIGPGYDPGEKSGSGSYYAFTPPSATPGQYFCRVDYGSWQYFFIQSAPAEPRIGRSPSSLSNSCCQGEDAPSQTFDVWNTRDCVPLEYTITDNVSWLYCSPSSGTSWGEDDTITVIYDTDGLPANSYSATITITDPDADNSPRTVSVSLTVNCCAPPTPTGVSASDGTYCGYVRVTWSSVPEADEYRVYRDGSPVGSWQPGTSYDDYLGDCATHTYQVKARVSCGAESGLSSGDNGYAKCVPSPPTGVSASDNAYCDFVRVTWNPVPEADEYQVYRDGSPVGSWQPGTSYDDYLGDCATHTYMVKARNSCGESSLSSGDPGKTMCTPVITLDPVQDPNPVCDGNDVTFTVVATGDSLHYQWKVDDVNVGYENPSYLWEDANLSDDGAQVVCEVWNDCDIVTSNATTLHVDRCVSLIPHQSDSDSDWRIVISEVTLYGSYWKTGQTWPVEPNPIPIGYVTNCGYLWKVGECYDYNDLELCPQCWQPAPCGAGSMLLAMLEESGPVVWSFNPLYYTPETPVEVSIEITPDPGTMVYAVEDAPPTGWTVDTINESGNWDDVNKKVKWGPFFDANIRTLTYNATPPVAETGEKTFSGIASFDGSDEPFVRTISDVCPLDGVGNLDDDCDVDFFDFAIFALHWLEGV